MADIIGMDELETFVLDFLAYRREQRMKTQPPQGNVLPPMRIECKAEEVHGNSFVEPQPDYIPPTIGMGWPYYKGTASNMRRAGKNIWPAASGQNPSRGPSPSPEMAVQQCDIIPALAPVVARELARFGPPSNQKALNHLINQVIASAMELPPVSESIQTAEIKPWGRVALLQAVVELLIRISTM